jgi:membrane protease YdiL (CAAX protease family)
MTHLLSHLLAAYAIVVAPWLGCIGYQKARKRFLAGDRLAKVKLYRQGVAEQVVTIAVVLGMWRFGGIPGSSLGIRAPYSWLWTTAALVVLGALLFWSAARLRRKAERIRKRFQDSLGMLFPDSPQERSWFGALSVGAGISEELVFRGFLFYYFALYIPHINTAEKLLLTSLVFGMAHIYQGWKRAIPTGIVGLLLALMYVFSGSLLLPVVVHAISDWRMLLILPPESSQAAAVESAA